MRPGKATCFHFFPIEYGLIFLSVFIMAGGVRTMYINGIYKLLNPPTEEGLIAIHGNADWIEFAVKHSTTAAVISIILGSLHLMVSLFVLKSVYDKNPAKLGWWGKMCLANLLLTVAILFRIGFAVLTAGVPLLVYTNSIWSLLLLIPIELYSVFVIHNYAKEIETNNQQ